MEAFEAACRFFSQYGNVKTSFEELMGEKPTIEQLNNAVWHAITVKKQDPNLVNTHKQAILTYWG